MKTIQILFIVLGLLLQIKAGSSIPNEIYFIINYLKEDIEQEYLPSYCSQIEEYIEPAVKDLIMVFKITKQYIRSNNKEIIYYLERYLQIIENKKNYSDDINFKNIKLLNSKNLATIFVAKQILLNQISKEEKNITRSSATFSTFFTGLVHSSDSGIFYSSLLTNADVDAAAGIVDTKLATISTAGKVLNSATTATSANTASAIVARDSSNSFSTSNILLSDGTVAAPCLGFISETNSGIYRNGASSLGVSVAGTNKALFESTGLRYVNNFKVDVYAGANRTLTATTETVRYNTENIDSNNNFNTATFTYTAPLTGTYLVAAHVSIDTPLLTGGNKVLQLVKNGTPQTGYSNSTNIAANTRGDLNISSLIALAASDALTIQYTGAVNDVVRANDSHLSIILVSI